MVEIGFEFPGSQRRAVFDAVFSLEGSLRPVAVSYDEDEDDIAIEDSDVFMRTAEKRETGFALKSALVDYDFSLAKGRTIRCFCEVKDGSDAVAKKILIHMAAADPLFGYACDRDERVHWNRAILKKDWGTLEAWLGRGTTKHIPGLYWLTLLSAELALRHDVSLDTLAKAAVETTAIGLNYRLFQLYDRPGDWRSASHIHELRSSLDGVFDIRTVMPYLVAAKSFMDVQNVLRTVAR